MGLRLKDALLWLENVTGGDGEKEVLWLLSPTVFHVVAALASDRAGDAALAPRRAAPTVASVWHHDAVASARWPCSAPSHEWLARPLHA